MTEHALEIYVLSSLGLVAYFIAVVTVKIWRVANGMLVKRFNIFNILIPIWFIAVLYTNNAYNKNGSTFNFVVHILIGISYVILIATGFRWVEAKYNKDEEDRRK